MTNQQLDARYDDAAARLLLGEHLVERGDSDAVGYLWMGRRCKYPAPLPPRPIRFDWYWLNSPGLSSGLIDLPHFISQADLNLAPGPAPAGARLYRFCRDAELAVCDALLAIKRKEWQAVKVATELELPDSPTTMN